MSTSKVYQAECFTPKKSLRRSPPCTVQQPPSNQENEPPLNTQDKVVSQDSTTSELDSCSYEIGGGALREVQDSCFTPKRSLKRSPTAVHTPSSAPTANLSSEDKHVEDIDKAPPPSRWEIPRTPVQSRPPCTPVQYQQYQVQSPSDRVNNKSTPRRVKTPTHPLTQSARAKHTPRKRLIKSPSAPACRSSRLECGSRSSSLECGSRSSSLECGSRSSSETTNSTILSPPVTADKGPPQMPGLQYTANDLAYLQHVKMVKQVTELKGESDELTKAQKKTQGEKELLEHEAKKIDGDVATIKNKVQSITATVHELVSEESGATVTGELQQSQVDQLKRLNQKTAAELERAEREKKGKLAKVKETTEKLTKEIKTLELKQSDERTSLEAKLTSTQEELSSLNSKKQETCTKHQQTKDELELLQAEMARVSLSKGPEEESSKEQLEKSLRTLVRRCDLYVKRHNILKEMGI